MKSAALFAFILLQTTTSFANHAGDEGKAGREQAPAKKAGHVEFFLSQEKREDKHQLIIESKLPIGAAQFRSKDGAWMDLKVGNPRDGKSIYFSTEFVQAINGTSFQVRGTLPDGTRFVDNVEIRMADGKYTADTSQISEEKGLDLQTILYGSPHIDPQTLAQARAEYMAKTGQRGHLKDPRTGRGTGAVQTTVGLLVEGCGWSSAQGARPSTCWATNGSAPIGDGIAYGPGGTFRSRLYNSPATTNGSR